LYGYEATGGNPTHGNLQELVFSRVKSSHFTVNPNERAGIEVEGSRLHVSVQPSQRKSSVLREEGPYRKAVTKDALHAKDAHSDIEGIGGCHQSRTNKLPAPSFPTPLMHMANSIPHIEASTMDAGMQTDKDMELVYVLSKTVHDPS